VPRVLSAARASFPTLAVPTLAVPALSVPPSGQFTETVVFLLIGYGFWLYTLGHTSTSIAALHPEAASGRNLTTLPLNSPCLPPDINQVSGAFILLTLSMCLISRAVATFPLAFIANLFRSRSNQIKYNEQCVIWFSGLRGAIALALAVEFPTADEVAIEHTGSFCYQAAWA